MIDLLKGLERYFEVTPREQIIKDWEATAKYDEGGITVDELISCCAQPWVFDNINNEEYENPTYLNKKSEELFGFFLYLH